MPVRDLKGFRYLERLLADPGREFHVLDLVAVEQGRPAGPLGRPTAHRGRRRPGARAPVLDEQARAAYRRRLAEVDEDIERPGSTTTPVAASWPSATGISSSPS